MIRSMTGYGKSGEASPYGKITVEIKTLNHKSLSVTCNPLNGFFLLENKVNKIIERKISRGKIFVRITRESVADNKSLQQVVINEAIAREYLRKLKKAQKELNVPGQISLRELIALPGVMESSVDRKEARLWPHIKDALEKALDKLIKYRESEGRRLASDFSARIGSISRSIRDIKKLEKTSVKKYRDKLTQALKESAETNEWDRNRLESEVALFARSYDISEEITRLTGHVDAYRDAMKRATADVGKKLDFIAQEMQREANTIGAKSGDLGISRAVIEVKSQIEKMREQIKNIE